MRLITKQLWRAFPELDRFDDERCRRFIQSARRGKGARLGRALLNLLLSTLVFALIASIGYFLDRYAREGVADGTTSPRNEYWLYLASLVFLVLSVVAAGATALILRDNLLRCRVALFIHARGKCPQCRYILLGIRVPESLRVNCPECGLELEVDEALTELADPTRPDAPTATDQANTAPQTSSQPPSRRERRLARAPEERAILPAWFTPKRRKRTLRALLVAVAIAVVSTAFIWGYNWWFLQDQARRAAAQRVGLTGIDKISESLNPPPDGNKDAWDYFDRVVQIRAQAEIEVTIANPSLMSALGAEAYPEYAILYEPPRSVDESVTSDPERRNIEEGQTEFARKIIVHMGELGSWEMLDSMCASPRAFRAAPPLDLKEPPDLGMLSLTECRKIAQINAARMALAAARADHAEVCRALRANICLGRIIRRSPSLVGWLVADALESFTWRTLRASVELRADDQLLDAVHATLEAEADDRPPISTVLNAEREYQREYTRWFFSDPARVTEGWPTYPWSGSSEGEIETGTLDESLAAIDAVFDLYTADLARRPSERSTAPYNELEKLGATSSCKSVLRWLTMADAGNTRRRAGVLHLAIERYRARHGHPPETLEHLVPGFLKAIPADPLARDGAFRYRIVPPPIGTGTPPDYILYSVGADANDNSGTSDDAYPEGALSLHASKGQDYIIHRPANSENPLTPDPAP